MITDVGWAAVRAMWGRLGPSLIRLTAEFSDNIARLQYVVEESIGPEERDLYEEAATEFLSYFNNDSETQIEIVEVPRGSGATEVAPLRERVFLRNAALFIRA